MLIWLLLLASKNQRNCKFSKMFDVHSTFHASYLGSTASKTYSVYVHDVIPWRRVGNKKEKKILYRTKKNRHFYLMTMTPWNKDSKNKISTRVRATWILICTAGTIISFSTTLLNWKLKSEIVFLVKACPSKVKVFSSWKKPFIANRQSTCHLKMTKIKTWTCNMGSFTLIRVSFRGRFSARKLVWQNLPKVQHMFSK